jgi:cytochrome d ubiquinol oxidase subunit II
LSDLANVWFYLLGFILALYVMLDGFDLGVGIISLFEGSSQRQSLMMSSLSAVWDANETWLVIWGGALFGAFPLAYSVSLSALYIPVTFLLLALIFRGISFEFHSLSKNKRIWAIAFGAGSLVASISEGTILGGALSGIQVDNTGNFTGGPFDWLQIYTPVILLEVVAGFVLLGSTYLVNKTTGVLQDSSRKIAMITSWIVFIFSIITAYLISHIHAPIFESMILGAHREVIYITFSISTVFFCALQYTLYKRLERVPFILSLSIFFVTFTGLWVGVYPYLLPGAVTVGAAAAEPNTLLFMLIGIGPIIPVIIGYNWYVYHVFKSKVVEY